MKVAYLTAGAAGMYCGSCLNDNTLARTLVKDGVDVALIPTYTPTRTDDENVSMDRVFFGGINVYLQQKFSIFRKTPWFIDKLFNSKPLLKLASMMSGSTNARMLGELAIAVLEGSHGPLRKELDKLIQWLKEDFKPDLVHLTNAMFVGLAGPIKKELGVPVTCGLPGEDLFLDALIEPYKSQAMAVLRRGAQDIDAFSSPSDYYRTHMADYMGVPIERIEQVNLGLDFPDEKPQPRPYDGLEPFQIGFLARRAPEKGLHLLVDAYIQLAQRVGKDKVRLNVAGYLAPVDKAYDRAQQEKLNSAGLAETVSWVGEVDKPAKTDFYAGIHCFSMPAPYQEPKGRSVLEAMAAGVPVVQPRHGAFTEMVEATGGGLLVAPENIAELVDALQQIMDDENLRQQMANRGQEYVRQRYTSEAMAQQVLTLWKAQTQVQVPCPN